MKRVEHRKSHLGFTLIEMALVLGVIALVLTILLPVSVDMLEAQERKDVVSRLAVIDSALVNFVVLNRRLPCPADGTLATGVANAGLETLNAATGLCNPATEITGVVPWVTLGISENAATDPWGGRITYRVAANLANAAPAVPNRLMDMSWCDPVGTAAVTSSACTAGCTGAACTSPQLFLSGKASPVSDGNGNWLNNPIVAPFTGAAYVLISHGLVAQVPTLTAGIFPWKHCCRHKRNIEPEQSRANDRCRSWRVFSRCTAGRRNNSAAF
ncbi:MAG: type II secretion system protein [Rhodocyclaceae bacterium]|nr:type II secretion system protein [Rhodocyclaceae bacterium]